MGFYGGWAPYVPVAQRRRNAAEEATRITKKGQSLSPVQISGRKISTTFWGTAWCENLENYCDFDNRMPRGRTYARNGSLIDLQIANGKITSLVSGSSLYKIKIEIAQLPTKRWQSLCKNCSAEVTSLLELMRGKLPAAVIERLTHPKDGLFPTLSEIKVSCSCPDSARMCKHVAATLYGVGHRLDTQPELFFQLRGVDRAELVSQAMDTQNTNDVIGLDQTSALDSEDLGAMFGIDLSVTLSDGVVTPASDSVATQSELRRRKASTKKAVPPKSPPKSKSPSAVSRKASAVKATKQTPAATRSSRESVSSSTDPAEVAGNQNGLAKSSRVPKKKKEVDAKAQLPSAKKTVSKSKGNNAAMKLKKRIPVRN